MRSQVGSTMRKVRDRRPTYRLGKSLEVEPEIHTEAPLFIR